MKRTVIVVLATLALVAGFSLPSEARIRGEFIIGPVWGPGWWGPPYGYGYPYYPPPAPVVIQQQPQEYIYQSRPSREPQQYWYYCAESKKYYPYAKSCPGGWMKVVPKAAPAPDPAAAAPAAPEDEEE